MATEATLKLCNIGYDNLFHIIECLNLKSLFLLAKTNHYYHDVIYGLDEIKLIIDTMSICYPNYLKHEIIAPEFEP